MKVKKSNKSSEVQKKEGHGGIRKGSGRPQSADKKNFRGMKIRDSDWKNLVERAEKEGLSIGDLFVLLNDLNLKDN